MATIRGEIRRLSRAHAPVNCSVTVEDVQSISTGFMRVTVSGADLSTYHPVLPADAFKLALPPSGAQTVDFPVMGEDGIPYWPPGMQQPVLRAFTVRHFDSARRRLQFDVLRHPGVAAEWLDSASNGDVIGLSGMRREFHAGDEVDHQLLIGDSSSLPAISAIVESVPSAVDVTVFLAVNDADMHLVSPRDNVEVHRVAGASPIGADSALERAVRAHAMPPGRTQVWVGTEASVMRELRRYALDELHVARADLHSAAYWKTGLDSTQLDTVQLERYKEILATGADPSDPDTRDKVELTG